MEGPLRLVDSSQGIRVSRHIRPEASSSSSITGAVMEAVHTSTMYARSVFEWANIAIGESLVSKYTSLST